MSRPHIFLVALESAWRAGRRAFLAQYRKRTTELVRAHQEQPQ